MTVKQEHLIVGLLVLGAAGAILYVIYEGSKGSTEPQPAAGSASPGQAAAPAYPNAQPNLNFEVGGSPVNLTYNTFPDNFAATGVAVRPLSSTCGNGGCDGCSSDCDSCAQAQQPVTIQSVPPDVLAGATDQLNSFLKKTNRATFTATKAA